MIRGKEEGRMEAKDGRSGVGGRRERGEKVEVKRLEGGGGGGEVEVKRLECGGRCGREERERGEEVEVKTLEGGEGVGRG